MGLGNQFCFQIHTLETEKYRYKPKSKKKIYFWEKNAFFLTRNYFFENFSKFSVEAEKLIFSTKWVVLAQKQIAKFPTD